MFVLRVNIQIIDESCLRNNYRVSPSKCTGKGERKSVAVKYASISFHKKLDLCLAHFVY